MTRPRALVLVTGTGTEVGKTWVGARLLRALAERGRTVGARKPAQSYEPGDDDDGRTDAQVLGTATGEAPSTVCPAHRWYPTPMAPPMAAVVLGHPVVLEADLLAELTWGRDVPDIGLVESAGGVRSPLAEDGDSVTLAATLQPDLLLLVADAGLGTINAVHLSVAALAGSVPADRVVVVLNRYDPEDDLHRRNVTWLTDRLHLHVVTSLDDLVDVVEVVLHRA